jgi:nondiscriminating glutamyl-tRNA synthetase
MVKTVQQETSVTGKQLWTTIRVAIIGKEHGPDISKIAEILGKDRFLKRLDAALKING